MGISSDAAIDSRIAKMRKEENAGLYRMHKWLVGWENFKHLDEQIVLAHILGVLDKNGLAVSKTEVRNCFNRFYGKDRHGDKQSYLTYLYTTFGVKSGAVTNPKRSHRVIPQGRTAILSNDNQNTVESIGETQNA